MAQSQVTLILLDFAMFIFTTSTAFLRLENQWLKSAFARVGVTLPSEKWFRTTALEKCFERVASTVATQLLALQVCACMRIPCSLYAHWKLLACGSLCITVQLTLHAVVALAETWHHDCV